MPELKPTERYVAELTRIEGRMVRDGQQVWRSVRPQLLEAIVDGKRTPAFLPVVIGQLLASSGQQITAQLADRAATVGEAVARLVEAQTGQAPSGVSQDVPINVTAWQAATLGQMLAELSRLQASDADIAEIQTRLVTGDDSRSSLWDNAANSLQLSIELALWAIANGLLARIGRTVEQRDGRAYQKQAIAAIDERTTDCCLRVHGQVQPLDTPFHLNGTPRFADRVMNPPFHWRCRTASTLYLPEMEARGIPTSEMRDAARDELDARKRTGMRKEIHPAHSTSRR